MYSKSYEVLKELIPIITKYQGSGKMRGVHLTKEEQDVSFELGGYNISLKIQNTNDPSFGLVIQTQDQEFLFVGMNYKATISQTKGKQIAYIDQVLEGRFVDGEWVEGRWLNGDETYHNELLRVFGREVKLNAKFEFQETNLDVSGGDQFVYSPGNVNTIYTPGVYKVKMYNRLK